ncbi:MAG: twin-arginine translocase TatA/TatE family subunit [Myxococcota bacterium]|nr:twin-arginine translocase TatA/TatE family subunit [Myxococcota bacterium]
MLNIGAGELTLILVVALLVLGPARLPELARGLGKFLREFRSRTDEVRHVVEREFYRMDSEVQALPPRSLSPSNLVGKHAVPPDPAATPPPADLSAGSILPPSEAVATSGGPFSLAQPPLDPAGMPVPAAGPLDTSVAPTQAQAPVTPQEAQALLEEARLPRKPGGGEA